MGREGSRRHLLFPYSCTKRGLRMEDRPGGLVISSQSQTNRIADDEKSQPTDRPSSSSPQKIAPVALSSTDASEDDGSEERRGDTASPQMGKGVLLHGSRKRANPGFDSSLTVKEEEVGEDDDDSESSDSSSADSTDSSSTRAQHEALDDFTVSVRAKSMLIARLQETCPHGRLAMVSL